MKKIGFVLCGILCWTCSGKNNIPEIFIPEQYQKMYDMGQRMEIYDAWAKVDPLVTYDNSLYNTDTLRYVLFISPNLQIRDVFTKEEIIDVYDKSSLADKEKFAIYTINNFSSYQQLLLFNRGEFTVFSGGGEYPQTLQALIAYFEKHKDLDARLLPLCIQEITKIYIANRRSYDQYGPWRHWWGHEIDSLGQIYNKHLRWH